MLGMKSLLNSINDIGTEPIYEICKYKLKPTITIGGDGNGNGNGNGTGTGGLPADTIPLFFDYYLTNLPSRLHKKDISSELITVLYPYMASNNNEIIEIWRHGNGTDAMDRTRSNSRTNDDWRKAMLGISSLCDNFSTEYHKPASFSSWR